MEALSENILNRLNILTDKHEAVQAALRDVVARQKDVKRVSQRMAGRVSGVSVASVAADVDVASQQSTEMPFSAESSRCHHRQQSNSDEGSGLDECVNAMNRKLKKLTSKFHAKNQADKLREEDRGRSSERETVQFHRRLDNMRSGIRNARTSATHLQQCVSILELDLQDTRQRQIVQELLMSGVIKELVSRLKRELWGEANQCTQEQLAARALLWNMLSHNEERNASC
jgi:hypothetical protein